MVNIARSDETTDTNNCLAIIVAAATGAIALPVVGLPLLGAVGFTSAGVAGGDYLGHDLTG